MDDELTAQDFLCTRFTKMSAITIMTNASIRLRC